VEEWTKDPLLRDKFHPIGAGVARRGYRKL